MNNLKSVGVVALGAALVSATIWAGKKIAQGQTPSKTKGDKNRNSGNKSNMTVKTNYGKTVIETEVKITPNWSKFNKAIGQIKTYEIGRAHV